MNKTMNLAIPIAIGMESGHEEPGGGVEVRIKCRNRDLQDGKDMLDFSEK
jgi:hypothetical protein